MTNLSILQNAGKVYDNPYPHIIIQDALPQTIFDELHNTLPEKYVADKPVGPDESRRVKFHVLDEDAWPITNLWKEFFEYHTSREFFDEVMNLFGSHISRLPIQPSKIITGRGKLGSNMNCYQDCQFVRHDLVPEGETTRTPHYDNLHEIYAGLLYFKNYQDTSTGGDFHVHEQTQLPTMGGKNNAVTNAGPIVRTAPYKNNTVALFLNNLYAIHSVEPRQGKQFPRWSVNIIGRYTGATMGK